MSRSPINSEIAKLLRSVAAAIEVKSGDKFRIAAYEKAAVAIEHSTSEVKDIWDDKKLEEIPGVGKNIAAHLDELFRTGKVKHFSSLFSGLPPAMFVFMDIPGIGPKTAFKLAKELRIKDEIGAVEKLKKAAKTGKISMIEGFGDKSEDEILSAIARFKKIGTAQPRMSLVYAELLADGIINFIKQSPVVSRADPLGSLRRRVATIGDIDISVETKSPAAAISHFISFPKIKKVVERGETKVSVLLENGRQVDARFQSPSNYGSMLQYFTGGKQHNIRLREWAKKKDLSLSEYGIKDKYGKLTPYASEEAFYRDLGMEWIPPELREDTGEIETALEKKLPHLVELKDIKGDLHVHSSFPIEESHDAGLDTIEEVIRSAKTLGYEYLGFSEHNPSASQHSSEEVYRLISKKKEYIDKINSSGSKNLFIKVLNGLEIDIKPDGELALPEKTLNLLDYAIASVHSSFDLSREEMTRRIIRGLDHPKVKILGHPTGRKLGEREGYEVDWDKLFAFCLKANKWLEISAWPDRLDLPDILVREAIKQGVKLIINSDAHEADHLSYMEFGVSVARRGWAEKKDIVNTLPYDKIISSIREEGR